MDYQVYEQISDSVYINKGHNKKYTSSIQSYQDLVPKIFKDVYGDDAIEEVFWSNIGKFEVPYATGVSDTVFKFKDKTIWNTNHIESHLRQLCIYHAKNSVSVHHFDGISTPYIYYGVAGTTFALHIEDIGLNSVNYNLGDS